MPLLFLLFKDTLPWSSMGFYLVHCNLYTPRTAPLFILTMHVDVLLFLYSVHHKDRENLIHLLKRGPGGVLGMLKRTPGGSTGSVKRSTVGRGVYFELNVKVCFYNSKRYNRISSNSVVFFVVFFRLMQFTTSVITLWCL